MFEFAKSALLGSAKSSLPFTIGDAVGYEGIWSIHDGTKKDEDKTPLTILLFDISKSRTGDLSLARNALKRARTLRHPSLLRVHDTIETDTRILIACERVRSLSATMREPWWTSHKESLIVWGLHNLAVGVRFLNEEAGLVHGNLRIPSVFVTEAGEWKLGGWEVVCAVNESEGLLASYWGRAEGERERYAPPEVKRGGWGVVRGVQVWCLDAYMVGVMIWELFNGERRPDGGQGSIPVDLYPSYKALIEVDPGRRIGMKEFLERGLWKGAFFDKEFLRVTMFVEEIAIKDVAEKEAFIKNLTGILPKLPPPYITHKLLPSLLQSLSFGSLPPTCLPPILHFSKHLPTAKFNSLVSPLLIKLFASSDRSIRLILCDTLPSYITHLDKKTVTNTIWPKLAVGFLDSSAVVREATMKSVLVLAEKLSGKIVNGDLLRYLAKLQVDSEPGIRTNTTVLLGKLATTGPNDGAKDGAAQAAYLTLDTKKKVLVTAFLRALSDPFAPARCAGVAALVATTTTAASASSAQATAASSSSSCDYIQPTDISHRILPALCPLLLDPDKSVRKQALHATDYFIDRVKKVAEGMMDAPPPGADMTVNSGSNATASSNVEAGVGKGLEWAKWVVGGVGRVVEGQLSKGEGGSRSGTPNPSSTDTIGTRKPTYADTPALVPVRANTISSSIPIAAGGSTGNAYSGSTSSTSGGGGMKLGGMGSSASFGGMGSTYSTPATAVGHGNQATSDGWGWEDDFDSLKETIPALPPPPGSKTTLSKKPSVVLSTTPMMNGRQQPTQSTGPPSTGWDTDFGCDTATQQGASSQHGLAQVVAMRQHSYAASSSSNARTTSGMALGNSNVNAKATSKNDAWDEWDVDGWG
ncbi:armadillo-type protein [Gaertneriomyces semiglobifer]|nr:armadillo-type protein [Gaertneriomyces semiglobifer]